MTIKQPVGTHGPLACAWHSNPGRSVSVWGLLNRRPNRINLWGTVFYNGNITYLGNVIGPGCAGSHADVTAHPGDGTWGEGFFIDVWNSYRNGLWTSSIAIPVCEDHGLGTTAANAIIDGAGSASYNIGPFGRTSTVVCSSNLRGTLTVYDDGTITFA